MDRPPICSRPRRRSGNAVRAFRLLDLTLPSPIENLALDETLLDELDEVGGDPVLRFWESGRHFVVLGPSCRLMDDVHVDACEADGVPVLRRASGGGTVLQGPGCLSYALVLPLTLHPQLANIRSTNQFILERMASTLHRWEPGTVFLGTSDLAIDGRKISGNAQRRKRNALLFHGTILYAHAGHSHRAVSEATGTATGVSRGPTAWGVSPDDRCSVAGPQARDCRWVGCRQTARCVAGSPVGGRHPERPTSVGRTYASR